ARARRRLGARAAGRGPGRRCLPTRRGRRRGGVLRRPCGRAAPGPGGGDAAGCGAMAQRRGRRPDGACVRDGLLARGAPALLGSRCGAPKEVQEAGHVRKCPVDGSEHYPRTDPLVIVLVVDENDRCLLGRQPTWPPGRFSTLAGFVEPGETPEQAVVREVHEETRIAVQSCTYAGSQPWPCPSSLMLGYYAQAPGVPPRPDGDEISDARWFTRAELADALRSGEVRLPPSVAISHRLIEGWY